MMRKENWTQEQYAALLREELRPALGCTEPVSIALCAAAMTKALVKRRPNIRWSMVSLGTDMVWGTLPSRSQLV